MNIRKFIKNPLLLEVITASAILHAVLLFLLGGIVVYHYTVPDDADFDEAKTIEEIPPQKQVEVQIQQNQPKLDMARNLNIRQVQDIKIKNISVNVPGMNDGFQVSSGTGGLGGLGTSFTKGAIGLDFGEMKFFGVKAKGERVLIMLDADKRMVIDLKGGLYAYEIIKKEVLDLIKGLPPGALFNVGAFSRGNKTQLMEDKLLPVLPQNIQKVEAFLKKLNSSPNNVGVQNSNVKFNHMTDTHVFNSLKFRDGPFAGIMELRATHVALEQRPDTVFILSGRPPRFSDVRRSLTENEKKEWDRNVNSPAYQAALKRYNEELSATRQAVEDAKSRLNQDRKKKGLPPKVWDNWPEAVAKELGLGWKNEHPGREPRVFFKEDVLHKYFREILQNTYGGDPKDYPSVNVVVYIAKDEELSSDHEKASRKFVNYFRGKIRTLEGLDAIKNASRAPPPASEG